MLAGFEEQTEDLNPEEMALLGGFIHAFRDKIGPERAVKSDEIIAGYKNRNIKLTGARVRKIISYIRDRGLIPGLIASSKGYYISRDPKDIERWIDSLEGRIQKIRSIQDGARAYLRQLNYKTPQTF